MIWVRSRNCSCLVTWFCYQLIAKPGNKTATDPWPGQYMGGLCKAALTPQCLKWSYCCLVLNHWWVVFCEFIVWSCSVLCCMEYHCSDIWNITINVLKLLYIENQPLESKVNSFASGRCGSNYKRLSWAFPVKFLSYECHIKLLMLGAITQPISWANVDPDLCHHTVSLGHNELRH